MTKNIKISLSLLSIAVLTFTVFITPAFAINVADNGNTATAAPATVENHTTATQLSVADNGNTSAPATVSNGNTSAPATVSNGTTADAPAPATVDNGNTSGPAPVDTNTGGGNTSGGNQVSGGSSGGSGPAPLNNFTTIAPLANCSYLTTFLKFGGNNNSSEVTKLQSFLKNTEKLDVDINGQFDQKTLDAVKAFQAKYVNDTMAPWGVTTPTGEVFYTTQKKVNEIYCSTSLKLTAEQIATIEAYKNAVNNGIISSEIDSNATGTIQLSPEVGSNDNGQTASLANTSFFGKIWSFVKWIFGYK